MAARQQHPDGVAANFLTEEFPAELLKMTLGMLPASYGFVAPVSRKFRDLYSEVVQDERKERNRGENTTYRFSFLSESALATYLDENQHCTSHEQETSRIGAACGRIEWVERGGVFDEGTCYAAARGGQLGVLKWLRERGCPWDEFTCEGAALNGHLEVLRWALENGCPYNQGDFEDATDPDFFYLWDIKAITDPDFREWFAWFERERRPME